MVSTRAMLRRADYAGPMARRRRPVLTAPERIAGVIDRVGQHGATRRSPSISPSDWEAAVGARIAERARPVSLDRGVLVLRVASSVWASELSFLEGPILERLKDRGLDVHALRYRVGVIEAPSRAKAFRASLAVPAPLPLPTNLERVVATIEDDELRSTVAAAAQANLAWQAYVGLDTGAGAAPIPAPQATSATSAASRAARVPRCAGPENGPQDQTLAGAPATSRRKP